jgi:hypothetical protein
MYDLNNKPLNKIKFYHKLCFFNSFIAKSVARAVKVIYNLY